MGGIIYKNFNKPNTVMKNLVNLSENLGSLTIGQVKSEDHHLILIDERSDNPREDPKTNEFIIGIDEISKKFKDDPLILNIKLKKLELSTGFCEGLLLRNNLLSRHFNMPIR